MDKDDKPTSPYYMEYFSPFFIGWMFLIPKEHGPVLDGRKPREDILVGPFAEREDARTRAARAKHAACMHLMKKG